MTALRWVPPPAQGSFLAVVQAWYKSLPLFTKSTFTLIVGLWLVNFSTGFDEVYGVCLSPKLTLAKFEGT